MEDDRLQYLFENIVLLGSGEDKNSLQSDLSRNRSVRDFLDDAR
jgi:hypothetical protein